MQRAKCVPRTHSPGPLGQRSRPIRKVKSDVIREQGTVYILAVGPIAVAGLDLDVACQVSITFLLAGTSDFWQW